MLRTLSIALALLAAALPALAQDQFNINTGPARGAGGDPCQQSFAQAERQMVEARTLNDAQYKKERLDCSGKQECIRSAQKKYVDGQKRIDKQHIDAVAQRDICEQRRQSAGASQPGRPTGPAGAQPPPALRRLPPGAVATGDPDATDAGVPGFLGSFPGTKSAMGSFCYTYLCERNIWNVNPAPTENPRLVGHDAPNDGDAVLVYQKIKNTKYYLPVHFAVYQGNDTYYQRNGASSVEVVSSQFFQQFSNAIVRYVNQKTGK